MKNILVLLFMILNPCLSLATVLTDGTLDPLFATDGVNTISLGLLARLSKVVIQDDEKIVAVGSALPSLPTTRLLLVRFNTDGSLDTTFANSGILVDTRFAILSDNIFIPTRIVLQPDGKIVAAATTPAPARDILVARYLPNGTPDTSFNQTGFITIDLGSPSDALGGIALNKDGSILITGQSTQTPVIKLLANGQLDTSFGNNGIAFLPISARMFDIEILHNRKFVLAGSINDLAGSSFIVAQCNANGTLDTQFGTQQGFTITSVGAVDDALCMAVQGNGKILISGRSNPGGTNIFVLIRYTQDGLLDASFGSQGITQHQSGSSSLGEDIKIQSDGKIILVGETFVSGAVQAATLRFLANGTIDRSFGDSGIVLTRIPLLNSNRNFGCAIDSQNKIVCVGDSVTPGFFILMRIERLTCDSLRS